MGTQKLLSFVGNMVEHLSPLAPTLAMRLYLQCAQTALSVSEEEDAYNFITQVPSKTPFQSHYQFITKSIQPSFSALPARFQFIPNLIPSSFRLGPSPFHAAATTVSAPVGASGERTLCVYLHNRQSYCPRFFLALCMPRSMVSYLMQQLPFVGFRLLRRTDF